MSLTIDLSGFGPDLLGDYDFFSFTFSEGNSTAPLIWRTWQSRSSTAIRPTRAMPTPRTGPQCCISPIGRHAPAAYTVAKTDMMLSVPEPSTATLSLLSLAVLTFRRRN